jgi:hypothetical protein
MRLRQIPNIDTVLSPDLSSVKLSPIYHDTRLKGLSKTKSEIEACKPTTGRSLKAKLSPKANYASSIRRAVRSQRHLEFPLKLTTAEAQTSRLKSFTQTYDAIYSADFSRLNSPLSQSIKKLNEASKAEARILTRRGNTAGSGIEESYNLSKLFLAQKYPQKYKMKNSPYNIFPYLQSIPNPMPPTADLEADSVEVDPVLEKSKKLEAVKEISKECSELQRTSRQLKATISKSFKTFGRSFKMFKKHTKLVETSNSRAGLYLLREEIRKSKAARKA